MKSVYIETSVISYLVARPSRALVTAAHQQITRDWWDHHRKRFELFVSPLVLDESSRGDPAAAAERLAVADRLPMLAVTDSAVSLVNTLVAERALPAKAVGDALHVAIACVNDIDYLLTWNCRHLDNAETKPLIRSVCLGHGYRCPEICTPEELMGGRVNER